MMKTTWMLVLAGLCLGMFTACNKETVEKDPVEFYFYTTGVSETEQWTLLIDEKEMGVIPNVSVAPDCDNIETLGGLLNVALDQGRHCYKAKNAEGKVRAHGYIKCVVDEKGRDFRTGIGSDGMGGAQLESDCEFVTMGVFE
jgi:hypothetical protein